MVTKGRVGKAGAGKVKKERKNGLKGDKITPEQERINQPILDNIRELAKSKNKELAWAANKITSVMVKETDVPRVGKKALIIQVPYSIHRDVVLRVQQSLITELEKKQMKHVVFVAERRMFEAGTAIKGMAIRPRTRTLTSVHEALLEDIVGSYEIVGKRTLYPVEGPTRLKVYLDAKDKPKEGTDDRLETFAQVYRELTRKAATFLWPPHALSFGAPFA